MNVLGIRERVDSSIDITGRFIEHESLIADVSKGKAGLSI